MHDTKIKTEELGKMKEKLVYYAKGELEKQVSDIDTEELGEVVDMIKDLAEAEEKCWKSCYYRTVIKSMEESDDMHSRMSEFGKNMRMWLDAEYADDDSYGGMEYDSQAMGDNKAYYTKPRMNLNMRNRMRREERNMRDNEPRIARTYDGYEQAKKFYTTSKSPKDKEEMNMRANDHIKETIMTVKEMWDDADPELKRKMKNEFSDLLSMMDI